MEIQEAFEDIAKRKNYVPSPKTSSIEKSTPKDEETNDYARIKHSCAPGGQKHACAPPSVNLATSYAQKYTYAPSGVVCTPPSVLFREITVFCYFFHGNKSINSTHLIHNYSFRTKWFKRKANIRSFKGVISLLTQVFRVCFIFFVICLFKSLGYVLFFL
jgi:hypothetical protein